MGESIFLHRLYSCAVNLYKWQYNTKMVQHHDSVPYLNCTVISIDWPHIRRDGAGKSILLLTWNTKRASPFFHFYKINSLFHCDMTKIADFFLWTKQIHSMPKKEKNKSLEFLNKGTLEIPLFDSWVGNNKASATHNKLLIQTWYLVSESPNLCSLPHGLHPFS